MLLDLIIPLFSFRWPWLLMSSNSSWSASLFLFAVVALFRPESPAFAVVIRVRRSSNLYQYKSNRSASFKPQPPFIYINVCVYVCASADLMFFCAFCLWLSLLCAIYTISPHTDAIVFVYPNCSICHQSWSRHAPIRPPPTAVVIIIIIAIFIEVASMIFLYKFLCIESISLLICFVLVPSRPISPPSIPCIMKIPTTQQSRNH